MSAKKLVQKNAVPSSFPDIMVEVLMDDGRCLMDWISETDLIEAYTEKLTILYQERKSEEILMNTDNLKYPVIIIQELCH